MRNLAVLGLLGSLKDGAKVALAGRGFMKDVDYSLNVTIERRVNPGSLGLD